MAKTTRYLGRFVKSLFGTRGGRRSGAPLAFLMVAVVLATTAFYLPRPAELPVIADTNIGELRHRAARVHALFRGAEQLFERDVAPLERVLLTYRNDPALARRIAWSLRREGLRVGVEPRLLLAVLLVENPWINPDAVSPVGALGLMQVMPVHRGSWRVCPPGFEQVEANICYGAHIFAQYLKQERGNIDRALLRYNGCVTGSNTPNCQFYPQHVYARAGRASLLAWRHSPEAGSP